MREIAGIQRDARVYDFDAWQSLGRGGPSIPSAVGGFAILARGAMPLYLEFVDGKRLDICASNTEFSMTTGNTYTLKCVITESGGNQTLSFKVNREWQWDQNKYADTSEALRGALTRNPFMKVFVAAGYYDLATPYLATYYTLSHMNIDPDLRANITCAEYEAGHMLYLDLQSLARLKADVAAFMAAAL